MKNGQLQVYPRSLQGDMRWLLLPRYLPDQAVSVKQDGRRLRLSQVLIPKENKGSPSFAWATEREGSLASGFCCGATARPSCPTPQPGTMYLAKGRVGVEVLFFLASACMGEEGR